MLENLFEHISNKEYIKEDATYDQEIMNSGTIGALMYKKSAKAIKNE